MPIENLFSTPIWIAESESSEELDLYQQELAYVMAIMKEADMRNPWGDTVETSFKFGNTVNIIDHMPAFKNYLIKNVRKYLKTPENFPDTVFIRESWWNISRRGGFQHWHSHPRNDISGVWFYQTNEQDGNLMFKPTASALSHSLFSPGFYTVFPKVGKLVLFPSWLEHAVWLNNTDSERITVSFNLKLINE
jgi:uncharacterized protein (TIGR02466 family)